MSQAIQKAEKTLAEAQAALNAALLSGGDTGVARKALDAAQGRLDALTAPDKETAETATDDSINARAAQLVAEAVNEITARIEAALSFQIPGVCIDSSLAEHLVQSTDAAVKAADEHQEHQRKTDQLRARIHELNEKRQAIIAARTRGESDDEKQGPQMALIAADLESLIGLLAEHETNAPGGANVDVGRAHRTWTAALARAEAEALADVGANLQQILLEIADRVNQLVPATTSNRPRILMDSKVYTRVHLGQW